MAGHGHGAIVHKAKMHNSQKAAGLGSLALGVGHVGKRIADGVVYGDTAVGLRTSYLQTKKDLPGLVKRAKNLGPKMRNAIPKIKSAASNFGSKISSKIGNFTSNAAPVAEDAL
jgi:hypothetical protein